MAKKNPNIETWYPAPGSLKTTEDKIAHERWLADHPRPKTENDNRPAIGKNTAEYRRIVANSAKKTTKK